MWHELEHVEFKLVDSHEKNGAVRDTSKQETLAARLRERLNNSRNMLLIVTAETRNDLDWVPFEIAYAVDRCRIPIIAAYPNFERIQAPAALSSYWPRALKSRIEDRSAAVIHVPFKRMPLSDAIGQFDQNNYPSGGGLGFYNDSAYRSWGLM